MGMAEDAFERLRRVAFEGEHVERMAGLGARLQLSPGVIKTLVRLARHDGVSMGEMARGIGCDPSYITALVDDLDSRGLAQREPSPMTGASRSSCSPTPGGPRHGDRRGALGAPLCVLGACRTPSCVSCGTSWTRCWRRPDHSAPGSEASGDKVNAAVSG